MKGAAFRYGALLAVICCAAMPVAANDAAANPNDITDKDRVWRNFTREAATVGEGQIRLEVRGFKLEDDDPELDLLGLPLKNADDIEAIDGGIIDLLGSYGLGPRAEIGFDVPVFIQETRFKGIYFPSDEVVPPVGPNNINDVDVGDVVLYGKFKRMVASHTALAAGLELSLPTGVVKKRTGTGKVGYNPFLSSRYTRGRFAVGAHIGGQIFYDDLPDVFNWSVQALVRGNKRYFIRTEVSGRLFKAGGTTFNDIVVMPGFDFNLTESVTIRPTGLAHVTDEAVNWGIGVGIALTL